MDCYCAISRCSTPHSHAYALFGVRKRLGGFQWILQLRVPSLDLVIKNYMIFYMPEIIVKVIIIGHDNNCKSNNGHEKNDNYNSQHFLIFLDQ